MGGMPRTPSGSLPPSSFDEAVATSYHDWSPHFNDACRGRQRGPSRARRQSWLEEQRYETASPLLFVKDYEMVG
jgi:hypothetical protein